MGKYLEEVAAAKRLPSGKGLTIESIKVLDGSEHMVITEFHRCICESDITK